VSAARALQRRGRPVAMVNCNPETVSTDFDVCDRLYFEELSLERVLDICAHERAVGVVVSVGGQIPNNLAVPLAAAGVTVLGTAPEDIDRAENREKFSKLCDGIGVDQPEWTESTSLEGALAFARRAGYPVLVRPSYVLSGAAMSVAHADEELEVYLRAAAEVSKEFPVVLSKFATNSKEIELDGVARDGEILGYAISEHVENAGVHSGDATIVFPAQHLYHETVRRIKRTARAIARELRITGPFNIQFLARDNHLKVIECNLRASRSFPFVSKVLRADLIDLAIGAMLDPAVAPLEKSAFELDFVGVKAPQFSFSRLKGADPLLGVEMASTGEVACLGDTAHEAYLKAMLAVGYKVPRAGVLLSTGTIQGKVAFLESARRLAHLGLPLYATRGTGEFLAQHGVAAQLLHWPDEDAKPNALDYIRSGAVDLVINVPKSFEKDELSNDYLIRRAAVDADVGLLTNIQAAEMFVAAVASLGEERNLHAKAWGEYR
jgi:carbamoyl-phosphate synthase large subunit